MNPGCKIGRLRLEDNHSLTPPPDKKQYFSIPPHYLGSHNPNKIWCNDRSREIILNEPNGLHSIDPLRTIVFLTRMPERPYPEKFAHWSLHMSWGCFPHPEAGNYFPE